jgi:plastocyanin
MGLSPRPIRPLTALFEVVAITVGLTACGGGDATSSTATNATSNEPGNRSQSVQIADFAYSPPTLTVPAGTTVKFTNEDETAHTATSKESGAFDSGTIQPGKSAEVTLDQAGTFAYYCSFHPFMKGTITVE